MVFQGTNFYFNLLRKYVVVFGNFFSDIVITRTLPGGQQAADIRVPLQYAQKDKMLVRLNADPDANRPFSALLPVISFELAGMEYNATSHLNTVGRNVQRNPSDKNTFKVQYNPVPYDIHFNVFIYVKNEEDGHKILEQILPFFTPDWTIAMELVPDMPNEVRDIPVTLKSVALNDLYDGDFKQRRVLFWQLGFTMHAFFYGPERNKPMIKFVTLNQIIAGAGTSNTPGSADLNTSTNYTLNDTQTVDANNQPILSNAAFAAIYAQPGEFANGQPTANVLQSIDWHLIDVDDNWTFATEQVAEFKYYNYGLFSNNSYWIANSLSVTNNTTLIEDTSSGHHYISLFNKFPQSLQTNGKQYRFQADIKDMIGNRALVVTITDAANTFYAACAFNPGNNAVLTVANVVPVANVWFPTASPQANGYTRCIFYFDPTVSPCYINLFMASLTIGQGDGTISFPFISYQGDGSSAIDIQNPSIFYEIN